MKKEEAGIKNILDKRKENEKGGIVCIREINENLRRISNNQALTRPLRVLNESCEFKKRYDLMFEDEVKEEGKKRKREYEQRPEVKKRRREYYKEYRKRPGVKKRMREYQRKKFGIKKENYRI